MAKNSGGRVFGIGALALCVVMVCLVLACFAALSYSHALSEYTLAQKAAQATKEYYAADTEAQRFMLQLCRDYAADGQLDSAGDYRAEYSDGSVNVSFTSAINENKYLEIQLCIFADGSCDVVCWCEQLNTQN